MPKIINFIDRLETSGNLYQGFLLSKAGTAFSLKRFEDSNEIKLAKNENQENNIRYSLIRDENGKIFAIYNPGKKDGIANGSFGIIKIAQNIETGEWCLVKIQKAEIQNKQSPVAIQRMRQEKYFLQKTNFLHGYQERVCNDKNRFISYTFMTELPGLPIVNAREPEKGFMKTQGLLLTEHERLVVLKNCLIRLYELQQEKTIHRDLSPQNILIDHNLQVYFIDWGAALDADASGFCHAIPPQLGATAKKIRYANGYDFITLLDSFAELNLLEDEEIRTEILKIKQGCGNAKKGYNGIDILPLIDNINFKLDSGLKSKIS